MVVTLNATLNALILYITSSMIDNTSLPRQQSLLYHLMLKEHNVDDK